jgi:hypothetical protein
MDDEDFSFFSLFLQAVGTDELQQQLQLEDVITFACQSVIHSLSFSHKFTHLIISHYTESS